MRQTSFAQFHCSLARALEVIGDWWTPLILRDVFAGVDRFDDLAADLGISRNLLTARLDKLVEHDVIERRAYSEHPPRYRYALTKKGAALVPVLAALTAWGDRWETPSDGVPLKFRHHDHACTPTVCCASCGERLDTDALTLAPGPGGRVAPGTAVLAQRLAPTRRTARSS